VKLFHVIHYTTTHYTIEKYKMNLPLTSIRTTSIIFIFSITLLFIILRCIHIIYKIKLKRSKLSKYFQYDIKESTSSSKNKRSTTIKTLVVFGSGGHTSEMLNLLKNVSKEKYTPYIAIIADTDTTSKSRIIHASKISSSARIPDIIYSIPRSREVGQSYITSIYTTIKSIIYSIYIIGVTRPDIVICNGPGTCLPIIYSTLLYRIFGICHGNIIFIESFCRVQSLSLTGKLVFYVVDRFIVHWNELYEKYPDDCELIETFVKRDMQ